MIDKIIQEFAGMMSGVLSAEQNKVAAETLSKVLQKYAVTEVPEKQTGELLPKFIAAKRVEGCSEKSLKYYESTIKNMLESVDKPEQEITTDDLRGYLDSYQQMNKISKVTLDNVRRILSSFFSWLEDEDYVVKSPVRRIHKVKTTKTVKETYSDEALELMRDHCDNTRDLAMIDLLSSTGMRVGELVKLNRDDIDFDNRECVVLEKAIRKGRFILTQEPKFICRNIWMNVRMKMKRYL